MGVPSEKFDRALADIVDEADYAKDHVSWTFDGDPRLVRRVMRKLDDIIDVAQEIQALRDPAYR